MNQQKVLIIDDEPLAQDILETYIAKVPELIFAGKCKNALEAFSIINKEQIDLLLLDINMPEISGLDFLKSMKQLPGVILTTAYSEYALESYELNVVDYLLKPISFNRFLKAIQKFFAQTSVKKIESNSTEQSSENIIFVKADGKLIKVDLLQLWFAEGLKDYVRLWTETGKIVVHTTMKNIEEQLSQQAIFMRVHKSYIVNQKYVSEVEGNIMRVKGQLISIGNTYRSEVNEWLDKNRLA